VWFVRSSTFPNYVKTAKVTPYLKKEYKQCNYRRISVLPILSLILGRHVSTYLKVHLEENKLLYLRQSGFRQNHSCQTALVNILNEWISAL